MWEYRLIDSRNAENASNEAVQQFINQLGQEGWEIINLDFREPVDSPTSFFGIAKRKKK